MLGIFQIYLKPTAQLNPGAAWCISEMPHHQVFKEMKTHYHSDFFDSSGDWDSIKVSTA